MPRQFLNPEMAETYESFMGRDPAGISAISGAMGSAYRLGYEQPDATPHRVHRGSLSYAAWAAGVDRRRADDSAKRARPSTPIKFDIVITTYDCFGAARGRKKVGSTEDQGEAMVMLLAAQEKADRDNAIFVRQYERTDERTGSTYEASLLVSLPTDPLRAHAST